MEKIPQGCVLEGVLVITACNPYLAPPSNLDFLAKLDHWDVDFFSAISRNAVVSLCALPDSGPGGLQSRKSQHLGFCVVQATACVALGKAGNHLSSPLVLKTAIVRSNLQVLPQPLLPVT